MSTQSNIKFLNLETGYSFDGLWKDYTNTDNYIQHKGYIFWFPGEQSTGMTYTMPIAVIFDKEHPSELSVSIEDNDIFSLINPNYTLDSITIDGYTFDSATVNNDKSIFVSQIEVTPVEIEGTSKWLYVFNVACKSDATNEYICKINIGNYGYIRVGADFYCEYEPNIINLANMGVEIPSSIQKAIYTSNVHEDNIDNILINRKFKELLSNYYNIIANKGSYNSLINSIKWFEWENISLREIFKRNEAGNVIYNDEDLSYSMTEIIENTLSNKVKTSYISLYCELFKETDDYDSELNPVLIENTFKWSVQDLKLKLALLAKYIGAYFLPIHLGILHATLEHKIFTNTIKALKSGKLQRCDNFYDFEYIECNIKDNDAFKISNTVRAQVTHDTVFGLKYPEHDINYDTNIVFGVDEFPTDTKQDFDTNTDSLKTFAIQYYTGPGAIIPINLVIPNRSEKEYVKQTIIDYKDNSNNTVVHKFYNIFNTEYVKENNTYQIPVNFNILAKLAKQYSFNITFILSSSKTLTRNISFNVEDIDNVNINVYKVQAKKYDLKTGLTVEDFNYTAESDINANNYLFKIQNKKYIENASNFYCSYLPYLDMNYAATNTDYNGVKLNKTIVCDFSAGTVDLGLDTSYLDKLPSLISDMNVENYTIGTNDTNISLGSNINTIFSMIGSSVLNNFLYFISSKDYEYKDENDETVKSKKLTYITFVSKYFNDTIIDKYTSSTDHQDVIVSVESLTLSLSTAIKELNNKEGITASIIRNDYGFYPQFHNLVKIEGNTINNYTIKPYEALCCMVEENNGKETKPFKYGHIINNAEWTFTNVSNNTCITLGSNVSSQQPFIAASDSDNMLTNGYYNIAFKYNINGMNNESNEVKLNSAFIIKD